MLTETSALCAQYRDAVTQLLEATSDVRETTIGPMDGRIRSNLKDMRVSVRAMRDTLISAAGAGRALKQFDDADAIYSTLIDCERRIGSL